MPKEAASRLLLTLFIALFALGSVLVWPAPTAAFAQEEEMSWWDSTSTDPSAEGGSSAALGSVAGGFAEFLDTAASDEPGEPLIQETTSTLENEFFNDE